MIFQIIDARNERVRMWTGTAAGAIHCRDDLKRCGRDSAVADYKGRRLSASALYECMARENERHAMASLASFRRLYEPQD